MQKLGKKTYFTKTQKLLLSRHTRPVANKIMKKRVSMGLLPVEFLLHLKDQERLHKKAWVHRKKAEAIEKRKLSTNWHFLI